MCCQGCKRIWRHLKGTVNHGLYFAPAGRMEITAHTDVDWPAHQNDRISTGGYSIFPVGNPVSWAQRSKKLYPSRLAKHSTRHSLMEQQKSVGWSHSFQNWNWAQSDPCSMMWQQECHCTYWKPSISWKNEAHRNRCTFHQGLKL